MSENIGLIGTFTHDEIYSENRILYEGLGGVLYQASTLCDLGKNVFLYTNLAEGLESEVQSSIQGWPNLHKKGIQRVPGPGNRVRLYYPSKGERQEVLKSTVPPLNPEKLIHDLSKMSFLVCVLNSGFDITLEDWRRVVERTSCPVWMDVHSLSLTREINKTRKYRCLPEWKHWSAGVDYLQTNRKEVSSMMSHPHRNPSEAEMMELGKQAFEIGVKTVFITLGKEGVWCITPTKKRKISPTPSEKVVDTTGCGDIFCGATVAKLVEGGDPFQAASFGVQCAARAAEQKGIKKL